MKYIILVIILLLYFNSSIADPIPPYVPADVNKGVNQITIYDGFNSTDNSTICWDFMGDPVPTLTWKKSLTGDIGTWSVLINDRCLTVTEINILTSYQYLKVCGTNIYGTSCTGNILFVDLRV